MQQQSIVTLDLEGVLVPEIWIAFAEKTGIPELRRTTRDEPDYDVLMKQRLKLLDLEFARRYLAAHEVTEVDCTGLADPTDLDVPPAGGTVGA